MNSSERVAVVGANGQLGSALLDAFQASTEADAVGLTHDDLEISAAESVEEALVTVDPTVVINTAAFHNVEACENDPEKAFSVNAIGARNVAIQTANLDARVVYVSTDYVFAGDQEIPYAEGDSPLPVNVYGTSKLAGEHLSLMTDDRALVVRVSSLFGRTPPRGKKANFIESVIGRALSGEQVTVVSDITMSPTFASDTAGLVVDLIRAGASGVVHGGNDGSCTWYDLADFALGLMGLSDYLIESHSSNWPSPASRPTNSALTSSRLAGFGLAMRPWKDAVRDYMTSMGHIGGVQT